MKLRYIDHHATDAILGALIKHGDGQVERLNATEAVALDWTQYELYPTMWSDKAEWSTLEWYDQMGEALKRRDQMGI